jgi:precorrin-2/cobalt-factor-2 C20-methyltransferase
MKGVTMKKLYGIGTGPGAGDLLTIRATNVIREAAVIFAPNNKGTNMALDTASEFIEGKRIVLIDFPMGNVTREDYRKAADIIYNEIPTGESGAFLTIGDSMIYSTFIYVMDELEDKDIDIEVVPGIPSFVAASCASKIPLTVKGDSFLLCDEYDETLMDKFDSIAVLKTFKNKGELLDKLEEHDFKYTYVKRASLDKQEILSDKEEILKDTDYISLILGRKQEV